MSATIIPFELHLPTILPTIEGHVDYLDLRHQLVRIDQLLLASGLETKLVERALERWLGSKEKPPRAKAQTNYQSHCRRALRCNLPLPQFVETAKELEEWAVGQADGKTAKI